MWPELDDQPPRAAEVLLPEVLRRGHELRRAARTRRQVGLLGRAAAVLVVAGLGTVAARGPSEPEVRTEPRVAAPAGPSDRGTDSTTSSTPGAAGEAVPSTDGRAPGTTVGPGSTTTSPATRHAPLVVVEQRRSNGLYRTAVLDGGELVPITPATAHRQMPVVSPRGDHRAFQRQVAHPLTGETRWEIFTVRPDGSDPRQITGGLVNGVTDLLDVPLGAGSRWPSWSPDGSRLTFSCAGPTGQAEICVAAADGSGRRAITLEGQGYYQPTWSPDGRTIAAKRELDPGRVDLWLLDPQGLSVPVALPVPALDPRGVRLSWLDDGSTLVFSRAGSQLVALDVVTGKQRVIPTDGPARYPIACGAGQILYLRNGTALDDPSLRTGPLVLVGADGSSPSTLVPGDPGLEHLPSSCAAR